MNIEKFREYCLSMPESSEKMPFQAFPAARSILAFYVRNKIFCFFDIDKFDVCTIKCDPNKIDELKARYDAVDSPYNMSHKHWIRVQFNADMPIETLKDLVKSSYLLIVENKKQK